MVTVKQIVASYLIKHDYVGLCGFQCQCGGLDIMWCNGNPADCQPGHVAPCPMDETCDCGEAHIVPGPEPVDVEDEDENPGEA